MCVCTKNCNLLCCYSADRMWNVKKLSVWSCFDRTFYSIPFHAFIFFLNCMLINFYSCTRYRVLKKHTATESQHGFRVLTKNFIVFVLFSFDERKSNNTTKN